jgi:hypothetical protein
MFSDFDLVLAQIYAFTQSAGTSVVIGSRSDCAESKQILIFGYSKIPNLISGPSNLDPTATDVLMIV